MFRKIVDYITSLVRRVARRLFGSTHKSYTYGRRYEPELPVLQGYEDFKSDWFRYEEEYYYNFELA